MKQSYTILLTAIVTLFLLLPQNFAQDNKQDWKSFEERMEAFGERMGKLSERITDKVNAKVANLNIEMGCDMEKLNIEINDLVEDITSNVKINWDGECVDLEEFSVRMEDLSLDLEDDLEELDEELATLDVELEGLDEFLKFVEKFEEKLDKELVNDGIIDNADEDYDFHCKNNVIYVNDKPLPDNLQQKYLDMMNETFEKKYQKSFHFRK